MNILDNGLVRKYFGCEKLHPETVECVECLRSADRILTAMQQPIRKGDAYIVIGTEKISDKLFWTSTIELTEYHPCYLRLPDRFQLLKMQGHCDTCSCPQAKPEPGNICGIPIKVDPNLKPGEWRLEKPKAPVEEKIQDLMQYCIWGPKDQAWFVGMLRGLVKLARETK